MRSYVIFMSDDREQLNTASNLQKYSINRWEQQCFLSVNKNISIYMCLSFHQSFDIPKIFKTRFARLLLTNRLHMNLLDIRLSLGTVYYKVHEQYSY